MTRGITSSHRSALRIMNNRRIDSLRKFAPRRSAGASPSFFSRHRSCRCCICTLQCTPHTDSHRHRPQPPPPSPPPPSPPPPHCWPQMSLTRGVDTGRFPLSGRAAPQLVEMRPVCRQHASMHTMHAQSRATHCTPQLTFSLGRPTVHPALLGARRTLRRRLRLPRCVLRVVGRGDSIAEIIAEMRRDTCLLTPLKSSRASL